MKLHPWPALLVALAPPSLTFGQESSGDEAPVGVVLREADAFDGYTLFGPMGEMATVLIDMDGEVVHRWETDGMTECGILLDDGTLLRWGVTEAENPRFTGPGVDGGIVDRLAWDGEVLWRYVLDDDYQLLHHDIALLPNGNVMFLAWEHRYREDAIAMGRDPARVGEVGMWPDAVYEIRPTPPEGGEIVWEWHAWDHLIQDFDETKANYGSIPDDPGRIDINADHRDAPPMTLEEREEELAILEQMAALGYGGDVEEETGLVAGTGTAPDWLHTNAIDYLPEYDLIVLSSPTMNEVWVIDHSTTSEEAADSFGGRYGRGGDLLWRWGNPKNYGAGEASDQQLSFQHDPTWLTPVGDELRLLVFNNGRVRDGDSYSSVDELVLPFDPKDAKKGFAREPGKAFGPSGPVWSYSDPGNFYSSFISGAQRLPNGNTLICSGAQGRIFEVTPDGRVVWDYRSPFFSEIDQGIPPNSVYRAVRVAKDHPGLAGRF